MCQEQQRRAGNIRQKKQPKHEHAWGIQRRKIIQYGRAVGTKQEGRGRALRSRLGPWPPTMVLEREV